MKSLRFDMISLTDSGIKENIEKSEDLERLYAGVLVVFESFFEILSFDDCSLTMLCKYY